MKILNEEEKIDVVISWVDGSDPVWHMKKTYENFSIENTD